MIERFLRRTPTVHRGDAKHKQQRTEEAAIARLQGGDHDPASLQLRNDAEIAAMEDEVRQRARQDFAKDMREKFADFYQELARKNFFSYEQIDKMHQAGKLPAGGIFIVREGDHKEGNQSGGREWQTLDVAILENDEIPTMIEYMAFTQQDSSRLHLPLPTGENYAGGTSPSSYAYKNEKYSYRIAWNFNDIKR